MNDTKLRNITSGREANLPKMYSPHLLPLLQSLLATLADIDFEHERELEKINKNQTDTNLKIKVIEKLKAQHCERREPYIRQLAILQEKILPLRVS